MQLNIYVPKDKVQTIRALEAAAKRTGKQKNELVLEALEAFLAGAFLAEEKPTWQTYDMGEFTIPSREELYAEVEDLHFPERVNDPSGH